MAPPSITPPPPAPIALVAHSAVHGSHLPDTVPPVAHSAAHVAHLAAPVVPAAHSAALAQPCAAPVASLPHLAAPKIAAVPPKAAQQRATVSPPSTAAPTTTTTPALYLTTALQPHSHRRLQRHTEVGTGLGHGEHARRRNAGMRDDLRYHFEPGGQKYGRKGATAAGMQEGGAQGNLWPHLEPGGVKVLPLHFFYLEPGGLYG
jgi:hypothetical protein